MMVVRDRQAAGCRPGCADRAARSGSSVAVSSWWRRGALHYRHGSLRRSPIQSTSTRGAGSCAGCGALTSTEAPRSGCQNSDGGSAWPESVGFACRLRTGELWRHKTRMPGLAARPRSAVRLGPGSLCAAACHICEAADTSLMSAASVRSASIRSRSTVHPKIGAACFSRFSWAITHADMTRSVNGPGCSRVRKSA